MQMRRTFSYGSTDGGSNENLNGFHLRFVTLSDRLLLPNGLLRPLPPRLAFLRSGDDRVVRGDRGAARGFV